MKSNYILFSKSLLHLCMIATWFDKLETETGNVTKCFITDRRPFFLVSTKYVLTMCKIHLFWSIKIKIEFWTEVKVSNDHHQHRWIKTLEIKAWWDRRPKINLNFRAIGLQEAVAGAFEPVNECYCISGIFLEKNVSGQHNYYKQLNINLHLKFSLDQFSSCSKNISSSIFCFSVLSFLVIPRHSHKPMSWRFFIHKKVKTFTFLK